MDDVMLWLLISLVMLLDNIYNLRDYGMGKIYAKKYIYIYIFVMTIATVSPIDYC